MAATDRLVLLLALAACGDDDAGPAILDASTPDARAIDAASPDADPADASPPDAFVADAAPGFCDDEERDDDYLPGMARTGDNGFTVTLVSSEPGPPLVGDNTWTVEVRDPRQASVDGLTIRTTPYMPDHMHGTAVVAMTTPSGLPGGYRISPVNLWMKGFWTVRLALLSGEVELDRVSFAFCLEP